MTRVEFTRRINNLIAAMILEGEHPVIDYVKRSPEEQKRLFDAGLSKCDGVKVISKHQIGRAVDIYFIENDQIVEPRKGFEFWHMDWQNRGGAPIIEWDKGHFEG